MGKFKSLFGSGPSVAPLPPPAPERDSSEADEAMRRQRLVEKRRQGSKATMLASRKKANLFGEVGDTGGLIERPQAKATFG